MEIIGFVAGTVAFLVIPATVAMAITTPLRKAACGKSAIPRFSLGDVLCLVWLLQIPLALIASLPRPLISRAIALIMAWTAVLILWRAEVMVLSRARVLRASHRCVFLAFVLPIVVVGPFAASVALIATAALFFSRDVNSVALLIVLSILGVSTVGLILATRYTRNIVADANYGQPTLSVQSTSRERNTETPPMDTMQP